MICYLSGLGIHACLGMTAGLGMLVRQCQIPCSSGVSKELKNQLALASFCPIGTWQSLDGNHILVGHVFEDPLVMMTCK